MRVYKLIFLKKASQPSAAMGATFLPINPPLLSLPSVGGACEKRRGGAAFQTCVEEWIPEPYKEWTVSVRGGLCAWPLRSTFKKRSAVRSVGGWQLPANILLGCATIFMPRHTLPGLVPVHDWVQWAWSWAISASCRAPLMGNQPGQGFLRAVCTTFWGSSYSFLLSWNF